MVIDLCGVNKTASLVADNLAHYILLESYHEQF